MKSEWSERRQESLQMAWGVAAVSCLIMVLLLTLQLRPSPTPEAPRVLRAAIASPQSGGFDSDPRASDSQVAVSPDGLVLAIVADGRLWLRYLDAVDPTPIPGTEGGQFPFWSPDSGSLGFFADGRLKTVAVTGGPVSEVCGAPAGRGGSWGVDGTILFAPDLRSAIFRVAAAGGRPEAVTEVDAPKHSTHRWPLVLADERRFLFFAASHANPRGSDTGIYIASLGTDAAPRLLTRSDSKPVISAGHLLFLRGGDLWAQPFDPAMQDLVGEAEGVASGVRLRGSSWAGMFSGSRQEVLAYERGPRQSGEQLTWIDRLGNDLGSVGELGVHWDLRVSPQGDRLAVATGSVEPELWIYELDDRGERSRVPSPSTFNRAPVWSPTGDRLAFAALNDQGRLNIYVVSSRGGARASRFQSSELDQVPTSWSPDGQWLAYDQGIPGATQIWVAPLAGDGDPRPIIETPPWAGDGQFSPDGRWLLYTSRETGVDQVYVVKVSEPSQRWQVSASGWSSHGRWSQLGDRVFFATAQGILMEVELRSRKGGDLDVGMPRMLFSYRTEDSLFRGHHGFYEVLGVEERFLVAQGPAPDDDQGLIMLVVAWSAELETVR